MHSHSYALMRLGFSGKKKKAACEQVINNYIIAKTGKGQIKVAEGPLIPAFPSYWVLRCAVLAIF